MYQDDRLFQKIGDIIEPMVEVFARRYSNHADLRLGSRFINSTPCPLCEVHLRGQDCGSCPMDLEFGRGHVLYGQSGCKVAIKRAWGPFTFGDYPGKIIRTQAFNPQLEAMNRFALSIIPNHSLVRMY